MTGRRSDDLRVSLGTVRLSRLQVQQSLDHLLVGRWVSQCRLTSFVRRSSSGLHPYLRNNFSGWREVVRALRLKAISTGSRHMLRTKGSFVATGWEELGVLRSSARPVVEISSYPSALEVLRSASVSSETGSAVDHRHFRGGTVVRIDGTAHATRRRALNRLLRRNGHQRFRDSALVPTVQSSLARLLRDATHGGLVQTDLVAFGQ
jgi:hypothetical protein